jgi:hypothetical protein
VQCERFVVEGDVAFGARVVARGRVTLRAPAGQQLRIEDGTILEGDVA